MAQSPKRRTCRPRGRLLYLKGLIGAWFENETVGSVRGPCQFMTVLEGRVWIRLHGILLFHRVMQPENSDATKSMVRIRRTPPRRSFTMSIHR